MYIQYKTHKDLPCDKLFQLFLAVGWSDSETVTPEMLQYFNIGFLNSTFVFSVWKEDQLIGCVRVLSDLHFRSIILDLAVLPEYQHMGIGKELVKKCIDSCPNSEWLVQTDKAKGFYQKVGFIESHDDFLRLPSKWF